MTLMSVSLVLMRTDNARAPTLSDMKIGSGECLAPWIGLSVCKTF